MTRPPLAALLFPLLLAPPALADTVIHKVGAVTWHAASYAGQAVAVKGYLLKREAGYVLFSDEPGGRISAHDLPVAGAGIETLEPKRRYLLTGRFVKGGLAASNGNPYHLELTSPPKRLIP